MILSVLVTSSFQKTNEEKEEPSGKKSKSKAIKGKVDDDDDDDEDREEEDDEEDKIEADDAEEEEDEAEEEDEESNDKIEEIKKPKRKHDDQESDLDSSRYLWNLYSVWISRRVLSKKSWGLVPTPLAFFDSPHFSSFLYDWCTLRQKIMHCVNAIP